MAFAVFQVAMPLPNGQKNLQSFFERSNNGFAPRPADQTGVSSLSVSLATGASAEALPKAPSDAFSATKLPTSSIKEHIVQSESEPIANNDFSAQGSEEVVSYDETVLASQPEIRNEIRILDGAERLAMGGSRKRRKLSPCTEPLDATAIDRIPGSASHSPPGGLKHLGSVLEEESGPCQSDHSMPSPGSALAGDRDSDSQESITDEMGTGTTCPDYSLALERKGSLGPISEARGSRATVKKVLGLNGAGGLGSTTSNNPRAHELDGELHVGSPRDSKSNTKNNTKVVVLRYTQSDKARQTLIGERIERMQLMPSLLPIGPHRFSSRPNATKTSRPTHPFFLGKTSRQEQERTITEPEAAKLDPAPPVKQDNFIMSFSTPGKMRYQAHKRADDRLTEVHDSHQARFRTAVYLSGTSEPPWPAKGFVHVGRLRPSKSPAPIYTSNTTRRFKGKHKATELESKENVLHYFSSRLFSTRSQKSPGDQMCSLRRPIRLLLSSDQLKARVLANLKLPSGDEQNLGHGALVSIFDKIGSSVSPFDKGECEYITWAQKYGPNSTAEVLQPEREMQVLRTWLAGRAVVTTDCGSLKNSKPLDERRRPKKKRQRLADDLDAFIVDSDDDDTTTMRDLSDRETAAGEILDALPPSRIEDCVDGFEGRRSANAVLISGPHGCGKTAAALAAAKELGFEVFEIGPGNRRSGKDILEKVGDMTMNHQVRKSDASSENERTPQGGYLPQVHSENQGTLSSFITPGSRRKLASKVRKDSASPASRKLKSSARLQQSLILLEEVDILFEQDRQFWETVLELAIQSKRPIIMTCSDEDLVPLHALSLHAILRFRAPQERLAATYLLLLAAAEGHLLSYEAASSIYKFRGFDLRASIFDLNFWCQMAVGDRKGGMDWYHEKWPPGAELDDRGHPLRIVSENTLVPSMGVLDQSATNHEDLSTIPERLALEAWAEWNFEPANLSQKALDDLVTMNDTSANPQSTLSHLDSLSNLDRLSELMSAVDVFSSVDVPSAPQAYQILDTTQPPILESQKADFIQGRHLLQTDSKINYLQFDTQVATYVHLHVREEACKIWHTSVIDECGSDFTLKIREQLVKGILDQHTASQADLGRNSPRLALSTAFRNFQEEAHALPSISSFDRNVSIMAEDLAPYIRSIAAYDQELERRRDMLSLIEGGPNCARTSRKTRVSRSAMEGSQRATSRRERWFGKHMNLEHVLKTARSEWQQQIQYQKLEKEDNSPRVHENLKRDLMDR